MKNEITLTRNAWFGDDQISLKFPDEWNINLIQSDILPALNIDQIHLFLADSIARSSFQDLMNHSKKVIILVDDLTRPTPVESVISLLINELLQLGILKENITLLIACGTHSGITQSDISKKLGAKIAEEHKTLIHDCHKDTILIGRTSRNTPIEINRALLEHDIKIGISGVYPHPIAGFSGGGKLLALGAGGYNTIRTLHDHVGGALQRNGSIDHEFRRDINEIVEKVGYDLSINVVLNQEREIAGCFCGSSVNELQNATNFYLEHFVVRADPDADMIISDMYPFDMDFQYAFDRGLWPFEYCSKSAIKIILASSPLGISSHELFPIKNPFLTRLIRRMRYGNIRDILQLKHRLNSFQNVLWRRQQKFIVISPYLSHQDLKATLPKSHLVPNWNACLEYITPVLKNRSKLKVVIYKNAPLLLGKQVKH